MILIIIHLVVQMLLFEQTINSTAKLKYAYLENDIFILCLSYNSPMSRMGKWKIKI